MDLFSQYKKQSNESLKQNTHSSSNKDVSLSQRPSSSPTSSVNQSKQQQQQQQQQFATKLPSEKSPASSFLKEALLTGSSVPKISTSPLAVDNMINKSINNPKPNTNASNTSTIKPPTTLSSPTNNTQRSSGSNKSTTNRPSTDFTHHRSDQQVRFLFFLKKIYLSNLLGSTEKNAFIYKSTSIKYIITFFCFTSTSTSNNRIYFYN